MGALTIIFLLISTGFVVSCKEFMPVLIWTGRKGSRPFAEVTAFAKIGTNEFTDYLLKKVKVEKPTILAFLEENLSVEDFSWRDTSGEGVFTSLKNITKSADDVVYLPSVQGPKKGLLNLKSFGYSWKSYNDDGLKSLDDDENVIFEVKLKEPESSEDRPDLLRSHDEQIAKVYNKMLSLKQNVLAVYSGNHNSWFDNEIKRVRRDAADVYEGPSTRIITDDKGVVRMSLTPPIIYRSYDSGKETEVSISEVIGTPTTDVEKNKLSMTVRFRHNETGISIKFEFSSAEDDWWSLESAEILDLKQKDLIPTIPIGAPADYSYFCNPIVVFSHGTASLMFENLQVQPRVGKGNDFGPVMHCIPFFSIGIWSGLVIVVILSVVLAWGIVMIMDINTNDRFDDPKGKTITITATD